MYFPEAMENTPLNALFFCVYFDKATIFKSAQNLKPKKNVRFFSKDSNAANS